MTEVSMGKPLKPVTELASSDSGDPDIIRYLEETLTAIAAANVRGLSTIMEKVDKDPSDDGIAIMMKELEELFERFNSQQIAVIKKSLKTYAEGGKVDLTEIEKCTEDILKGQKNSETLTSETCKFKLALKIFRKRTVGHVQIMQLHDMANLQEEVNIVLDSPDPSSSPGSPPNSNRSDTSSGTTSSTTSFTAKSPSSAGAATSGKKSGRKWSDSWKQAIKGVLTKHRRERIRDIAVKLQQHPNVLVPKSDATKERLRALLSQHFIFGDLENDLREEIIDVFQDVRVSAGTEVIKQGDVADNFYIIDVGEFDILATKGKEPYVLLRSKGAGESFGELAMMYDTVRNATVKATTYALLWAVNRSTFKYMLGRHLTNSSLAQVLRECPSFKKLSTKDLVKLSTSCTIQSFKRGQQILKAGSNLDRVYIVQEGQVRVSWGQTIGNPMIGKGAVGGETLAVMNRLEVLAEALILNDEVVNPWNYNAASDQVTVITMDRALLSKEMLAAIRKGLQVQLITLALQRVPAFLELSPDQLSQLAETFTQSVFLKGKEITRIGDVLGSTARIYVVQSGTIALYKSPNLEKLELTAQGDPNKGQEGPSGSGSSGWGNKLNNIIKGSISSTPGTGANGARPSATIESQPPPAKPRSPSTETDAKPTHDAKSMVVTHTGQPASGPPPPTSPSSKSTDLPTDKRKMSTVRQSVISAPYTITTYGVFGDECLLGTHKDDTNGPPCQATTVADSKGGVLVLSVSLQEVTSILGPIQELLSRITNLKILRKVSCLENLTSAELNMLSHSMGVRRLKPGEVVYKVGDPGDRLYIVQRGTVIETAHDKKSDQVILVKGSSFGGDALLSNEPRMSTMVAGPNEPPATTGAELYYLDRAVVEANLGPLKELNEIRKRENEKRGIVKQITFEELQEIGLLGTGLFGKVKLVYSRRTKEHYALKCVSKAKDQMGLTASWKNVSFRVEVARMQEEEHLRNEKIHMSELDHPFITKLIRTFKDARNVYLLQELTTGRELFLFMEKVGRLQEWEAAFYAGGVLLALEYMHSKGIVYRDLKPENTLIGENGYPKLIDMGFAKRIHNRRTYSMCGTPDYMAPEIIKRQGHGKAVDYWALGCMIFEMITNTSPFNRGDDPPQLVFQKITEGRMRFPPFMSAHAVDIVKRLLDPNPETRLGCRKYGPAEIKEHAFFTKEINFQLLIRQKEEPPMIPPKMTDYRRLCLAEEPGDPRDNVVPPTPSSDKANWDDIF